jgi:hypothetical protein
MLVSDRQKHAQHGLLYSSFGKCKISTYFYNADVEQQFNDAQAANRVIMNNRLAGNSDDTISQIKSEGIAREK